MEKISSVEHFSSCFFMPEFHSMNNQQASLVSELSQSLELYKASLGQALQKNISLIQVNQTINIRSPPQQRSNIVVKLAPSYSEQTEIKKEQSSLSNDQVDNKDVCKKSPKKKVKNKSDENDMNETKNIPKNFGKAILSFIQKNISTYKDLITPILIKQNLTISDLIIFIKKHKRCVNSINYLKYIWGYSNENNPIFKCVRILSLVFLKKHCLPYVFNSRVKNYMTHVKYRSRIIEGLLNPEEFTCIKQF